MLVQGCVLIRFLVFVNALYAREYNVGYTETRPLGIMVALDMILVNQLNKTFHDYCYQIGIEPGTLQILKSVRVDLDLDLDPN